MTAMSSISVLFYGRMKTQGVTATQIAQITGASRNTVRKWLDTPERMPLATMLQIADIIGIRKHEIAVAIERM